MVTTEIFTSEPNFNIQVSCIQFLEMLDGKYPETYTIRIIDDDCRVFETPEIQLYILGKRKGHLEVYNPQLMENIQKDFVNKDFPFAPERSKVVQMHHF